MRVLLASDGSPDAMQAAEWVAASASRRVRRGRGGETMPFPRTAAPAMIRAELQAAVAVAEGERRRALEQTLEAARPLLAARKTTETVASIDRSS